MTATLSENKLGLIQQLAGPAVRNDFPAGENRVDGNAIWYGGRVEVLERNAHPKGASQGVEMLHRLIKSTMHGLAASVVSGAVVFLLMLLYIHRMIRTQPPGTGLAIGGVLPCLLVIIATFPGAFIWSLSRK